MSRQWGPRPRRSNVAADLAHAVTRSLNTEEVVRNHIAESYLREGAATEAVAQRDRDSLQDVEEEARDLLQDVEEEAADILAAEILAADMPLDLLRQQLTVVATELEHLRAERDELEAAFAAVAGSRSGPRVPWQARGEMVIELVNQLTICTWHWIADKPDMSCVICLTDFHDGEEVAEVPTCRHTFHKACISQWFGRGRADCPMCRCDLGQFVEQGEELIEATHVSSALNVQVNFRLLEAVLETSTEPISSVVVQDGVVAPPTGEHTPDFGENDDASEATQGIERQRRRDDGGGGHEASVVVGVAWLEQDALYNDLQARLAAIAAELDGLRLPISRSSALLHDSSRPRQINQQDGGSISVPLWQLSATPQLISVSVDTDSGTEDGSESQTTENSLAYEDDLQQFVESDGEAEWLALASELHERRGYIQTPDF